MDEQINWDEVGAWALKASKEEQAALWNKLTEAERPLYLDALRKHSLQQGADTTQGRLDVEIPQGVVGVMDLITALTAVGSAAGLLKAGRSAIPWAAQRFGARGPKVPKGGAPAGPATPPPPPDPPAVRTTTPTDPGPVPRPGGAGSTSRTGTWNAPPISTWPSTATAPPNIRARVPSVRVEGATQPPRAPGRNWQPNPPGAGPNNVTRGNKADDIEEILNGDGGIRVETSVQPRSPQAARNEAMRAEAANAGPASRDPDAIQAGRQLERRVRQRAPTTPERMPEFPPGASSKTDPETFERLFRDLAEGQSDPTEVESVRAIIKQMLDLGKGH